MIFFDISRADFQIILNGIESVTCSILFFKFISQVHEQVPSVRSRPKYYLFIVGASVAQPENTTGGQASVSYVLGENNLPDHTHYLFDDGQADGIAATPYPGLNPPGGNYPTPVQMSKGGLHVPFPGSWINLSCVGYGTPGTIAPTQGFAPETTTGGCTAATGTITGGSAAPLVYPTIPTYYALYYLMRIA